MKLTRDLVDRLPARTDERGPVIDLAPCPDYPATTATRILADLPAGGELWVFAVGSLIWKPRFEEAERRPALVKGWHRAFCLGPDRRYRGCPSAPGYMLSLEPGGSCEGIVLRLSGDDRHAALAKLLDAEPPFPPEWVEAETREGPVRAIAFTVPDWEGFDLHEPPEPELVAMFASAVGYVGTMAEYLLNTVEHLEQAGIHDPHLWRLQELVAESLARLPERCATG